MIGMAEFRPQLVHCFPFSNGRPLGSPLSHNHKGLMVEIRQKEEEEENQEATCVDFPQ